MPGPTKSNWKGKRKMAGDRQTFIGGSDAPAILGVSPWATPFDVYEWKTAILDGAPRPPRAKSKQVLDRGKRLEPVVLQMLSDEKGLTIQHRNRRYTHPDFPFLSAEIDGETSEGDLVEVKTVSAFKVRDWGEGGTDDLPIHYIAQVQHQMFVTGRSSVLVAVLFGGDDFETYRVPRDDELIEVIQEKEIDFWQNHVLPRVPPPMTTIKDVEKRFTHDTGEIIEASEALYMACNDLGAIKSQIKELERKGEALEFQIKNAMADASILQYSGVKLATWKAQTAKRFSMGEFQTSYPNLFEEFKRPSQSRVFRLK